jgi:hypothetical protein
MAEVTRSLSRVSAFSGQGKCSVTKARASTIHPKDEHGVLNTVKVRRYPPCFRESSPRGKTLTSGMPERECTSETE